MRAEVIRVESRVTSAVKSYRDLLVWQKSMDLMLSLYKTTAHFPKEELYGLTSQLKRAAISIPSNIAEGSSRRSTAEFMRFINISTGSLAELETQIIAAFRLGFITETSMQQLLDNAEEISRMLQGLYNSLSKKNH